jgi:hypothetical protein
VILRLVETTSTSIRESIYQYILRTFIEETAVVIAKQFVLFLLNFEQIRTSVGNTVRGIDGLRYFFSVWG